MRWVLWGLLLCCLAACEEQAPRFVAVDVFVESGATPLAAWQCALRAGDAQVVGVEGGDGVFAAPPAYDPRALHREGRIVLAAFSTATALPRGRIRVARLHLRQRGELSIRNLPARQQTAGPDGQVFGASFNFVPVERSGK